MSETNEPEFQLHPSVKFNRVQAQELIADVLKTRLTGITFNPAKVAQWTKEISDDIKSKLRDLGWIRYKFVVQVVLGEQRGAGVQIGCRCHWDKNVDDYAQDSFSNESLYCMASAFGLFLY